MADPILEELQRRVSRVVDRHPKQPTSQETPPIDDPDLQTPEQVLAQALLAMKKAQQEAETAKAKDEPEKDQADEPEETASETRADVKPAAPTRCPQCQWPLDVPSEVEPTEEELWAWTQHLLGETPFRQEMKLLNGALIVEFREPTVGEMDLVFYQTYCDMINKKLVSELDFWERVSRYRMYVQLLRVETAKQPGIRHVFPDGLTPESNPSAAKCWNLEPVPGETMLPTLEKELCRSVLKTESMFRLIHHANNRFNRLVAKLEALTNNPNFSMPTQRAG